MTRNRSSIGRLVHFGSMYDPAAQRYRSPICDPVARAAAERSIRDAHEAAFVCWLLLDRQRQFLDVQAYLQEEIKDAESWLGVHSYEHFVPPFAVEPDRRLFCCALEGVLAEIRCERGTARGMRDWRTCEMLRMVVEGGDSVHLNLKMLAPVLRTSPDRLGLLFKRATGLSFHRYLRILRIRSAVELLRDPLTRVRDIAGLVGYLDTSNFVREFRDELGVTPGKFRGRVSANRQWDVGWRGEKRNGRLQNTLDFHH